MSRGGSPESGENRRICRANLEKRSRVALLDESGGFLHIPKVQKPPVVLINETPSLDRVQVLCRAYLEDLGRSVITDLHDVIDMIAHCYKQIEKQFATILHLHLHGSAPLESLTTSDDQG
jgi:hypothetical protein